MAAPHFAWQVWHLLTSTFVLRGRRGAWQPRPSFCVAGMALMTPDWIWWRAWAPLAARGAAALCMAGVALAHINFRFAWQAWRLATSTFVLRGRRGPYDTGLDLVARLGAVSRPWRRGTVHGRRGTCSHQLSFCVAGVALAHMHQLSFCMAGSALGDIDLCFVWQAWRLLTSTFVLRGRRGHIERRVAWQAWHLETSTFVSLGDRTGFH